MLNMLMSHVASPAAMAVPFWFCWTKAHIGARYFGFVPGEYHDLPLGDCVGVFVVLGVIGAALNGFRPPVVVEQKAK